MKTLRWPYSLENDRFSGDLAACNGCGTPPKSVQMLILFAIVNVPEGTQATMPTFKYHDVNGREAMLKEWCDGTGQEDANFRAAPKAVDVVWQPYGTVRVQKVKKILDEEIEKHFFSADRVIRTVQYAWQLQWSRDFADRIVADAKRFASRVCAHLEEKLQKEARTATTRITITEKHICFNAGGSYSRYINFEREGLVDLSGGVQVLGCAYAVRDSYGDPGEWEVRPYFDVYTSSVGQSACALVRDPKLVRREW